MAAPVPLGGVGASTGKLVGFTNFKRHNPKSDRFAMKDFDHLEVYTADATTASKAFCAAFGFKIIAVSNIDNGNHKYTGIVVGGGDIRFAFIAPYWTEAPEPKLKFVDAIPQFHAEDALQFIVKHGMAVRSIGIAVEDATQAYEQAVANGAKGATPPATFTDEHGSITYSEVVYYKDVKLRFVQGRETFKGLYLPGYVNKAAVMPTPAEGYGLKRIDHVVSNVPALLEVAEHLGKVLGLHEFSEFVAEDVGTLDSGLNSMVMANNDETVLLPINEPTFGTRRKSQIQSFLEHHQGSGVQHIAIHTDDIIATIDKMASAAGGVEFMPNPGEAYYKDHVPRKMQGMVTQEQIDACQRHSILIDRDEEGGLLQIFTKPLLDRPTLFVEIIQRLGCKLPDGRQKPACGGFGKGNFGALFKSIEDWEKQRDGEPVVSAM